VEAWRQGQALVPQVLRYWANHPERYALARTCVVDYAMPGNNGLNVLNNMLDWPGSRVLLTGQADEQIAVQAFNDGLIDQFVPKQVTDITRHLLGVLRKLGFAAHPRLNAIWRGTLRPAQQSLLQIPSVAKALQHHTQQNWVEYVVLGEPFGLLGLDAHGRAHWFQLEMADGLHDLAELAAAVGLRHDVTKAIEAGQSLAAVELHQQLGLSGPVRTAPAHEVGDDGVLFGAHFALDEAELPAPILGYRSHLLQHDHRRVQDS